MSFLERLHVEVTNICNFKCEFCPDAIMGRPRGHMSLSLLESILDELRDTPLTRIVAFHLMGEPFIYPHIFTAIQMAIERQLQLHLTTNGSTFCLRPDHIPQLVASGVPKVTISLQTPDPTTFKLRGAPPRLGSNDYFTGISDYVRANLQDANSPTRIHIKFLDTTPNPFLVPHKPMEVLQGKAQLMQELSSWAEYLLADIPDVCLGSLEAKLHNHKAGRWQQIPLHPKLIFETFPLDSWGNVESTSVIPAKFGYCNGANQQAGILYDGTVVPCCKDYEGQIPLGNVQTASLKSILIDTPACALRRDFNRLQVKNPVCQRCMGADTPRKSLLRQLASIAYFKAYSPLKKRLQPGWGEV
mgnify:CR=1 FL=1